MIQRWELVWLGFIVGPTECVAQDAPQVGLLTLRGGVVQARFEQLLQFLLVKVLADEHEACFALAVAWSWPLLEGSPAADGLCNKLEAAMPRRVEPGDALGAHDTSRKARE